MRVARNVKVYALGQYLSESGSASFSTISRARP
jgi:hypothetical protein